MLLANSHVSSLCLFIFAYCSEDGYIYEKEAILQYILHQKTEIAKKMKVWALFTYVFGSDCKCPSLFV